MPQGLIFWEARAINNAGQIIATTSVRPIPEPEMPALFLAGLCLVGLVAHRKKARKGGTNIGLPLTGKFPSPTFKQWIAERRPAGGYDDTQPLLQSR